MIKLSVIIPVFNEKETILVLLDLVKNSPLVGAIIDEIIVIDDCSTDGTRELLRNLNDPLISVIYKDKNEGKGSCLKIGFLKAKGDIVIIQDADLELDPADFQKLINPIIEKRADVVYGSRFSGGRHKNALFFWHALANRLLSNFSNLFTNLNLTDVATCYKIFSREQVDRFRGRLVCNRFAIDEELTAWVGHGHARIYEVGVSYNGRSYEDGKKINWRDGLEAVWSIIWFNLVVPRTLVERRITLGSFPFDYFLTIWRLKKAQKLLQSSVKGKILDIGCGTYPYFLTTFDFNDKYGIDHFIGPNVKGINLTRFNFENPPLPFPDDYFDAITILSIIEHLSSETAERLLTDAFRLLKSGGIIVITTPTSGADWLLRKLAWLHLFAAEEIRDHKQFYTKNIILQQLIKAGWNKQSISVGWFELGYNIWALAKK